VILLNIEKRRKQLGFNQSDMARLLGVHINTYRLWETGLGKPNEENMIKLKKMLQIKEGSE